MNEKIQIGLPSQNVTVQSATVFQSITVFQTPTLIHRSVHAAPTAVFTDCPNP